MSIYSSFVTDLEEKMKTASLELEQVQTQASSLSALLSDVKLVSEQEREGLKSVYIDCLKRRASLMNQLSKYRKDLAILVLQKRVACLSLDQEEAMKHCKIATQRMVMEGTSKVMRQLQTKAYMNLRRSNDMHAKYQKELHHLYEYGAQV